MHRIDTATKAVDLFGAGKHGWKDGDKANGIPATDATAAFFNDLQENLAGVVEAAGITLVKDDYTQLRAAIQAMIVGAQKAVTISNATFEASVADGEVVRWDAGNNRFDEAIADGTANNLAVGIADVTNAKVYIYGECALFAGLTPGARYFLDGATPGAVAAVAPADGIAIGIAKSATTLFIDIDAATSNLASDNSVQDFRLTLTAGVPVTTADVVGATSIYCTPYKGNRIALYSGGAWNVRASAEISLALVALMSGKPYDVFCYDDAGTPTLEALVWTNDTTRATALAYQDGVLVKAGDATRRYLGTFYTTGTTTTEDSAAKRYLWNCYHRVSRKLQRFETTASWSYSTAAWRQANGSALNQVEVVRGLDEDAVSVSVAESIAGSSAVNAYLSFGLDATNTPAADADSVAYTALTAGYTGALSTYRGAPGIGRHYLAWIEQGNSGISFLGASAPYRYGITGETKA